LACRRNCVAPGCRDTTGTWCYFPLPRLKRQRQCWNNRDSGLSIRNTEVRHFWWARDHAHEPLTFGGKSGITACDKGNLHSASEVSESAQRAHVEKTWRSIRD